MKYLIQQGWHDGPKWVVGLEEDFDTYEDALANLQAHSERMKIKDDIVVENIKMLDTGEDNPNKNPKIYHYITSYMPGVWLGSF